MYKPYPITGPFLGIVDAVPRPNAPANAFDDCLNFLLRKGRIQSRPPFNAFLSLAAGEVPRFGVTFRDINNNYHTLVLSEKAANAGQAYFLSSGALFPLTLPGGITITNSRPYNFVQALRRVYFSNGDMVVCYSDGSQNVRVAGDVPGGARFIGVLANHLIIAYTTEVNIDYPSRVRWSKSGDPNSWNTFSSGLNDILDVGEDITGYVTLSRTGYLFRKNGVTIITPTGVGTNPFSFDHFSTAFKGIGNAYPYSLASYGTSAVFVAEDDIYQLDAGSGLTPIGTNCKGKIFADLAAASSPPTAFIIPGFGPTFDYLSYWLNIPGKSTWVYHNDEKSWVRVSSAQGAITFINTLFTV